MWKQMTSALMRRFDAADTRQNSARVELVRSFVPADGRAIDVGCGDGRTTSAIGQGLGVSITGVDVIDYLSADVPFARYDGERLPFADGEVDVAFLWSVIHHSDSPRGLLGECIRVAKRVVLCDDYCQTPLGKVGLIANDYFVNILQNSYKVMLGYRRGSVFSMQWRLRFLTDQEIRQAIDAAGAKLVHAEVSPPSWKGLRHNLYIIDA